MVEGWLTGSLSDWPGIHLTGREDADSGAEEASRAGKGGDSERTGRSSTPGRRMPARSRGPTEHYSAAAAAASWPFSFLFRCTYCCLFIERMSHRLRHGISWARGRHQPWLRDDGQSILLLECQATTIWARRFQSRRRRGAAASSSSLSTIYLEFETAKAITNPSSVFVFSSRTLFASWPSELKSWELGSRVPSGRPSIMRVSIGCLSNPGFRWLLKLKFLELHIP